MREQVWRNSGRPNRDTTKNQYEISNDDIDEYLDEAFEEIYKRVPKKVLRYITTVADQQTYDVPVTVKNILEEIWESYVGLKVSFDSELDFFDSDAFEAEGLSLYHNPNLFDIFMGNVKSLGRMDPVGLELDSFASTMLVYPCPTMAGDKIYYVAGEEWEWTTSGTDKTFTDNRFKAALRLWAEFQVISMLAERRSNAAGVPRSGGTLDYGAAFSLKTTADRKLEQFEEQCFYLGKELF